MLSAKRRPGLGSLTFTTGCRGRRRPSTIRCVTWKRRAGNPSLLGVALNNHGEIARALGRLDEATECLQEALEILTGIEGYGQGYVLETLGHIHLESGHLSEAIASLTEAHRHHVATGQLMGQAISLKRLGQAQRALGQDRQARESLVAALALFEKLRAETEAEAVRAALAAENVDRRPGEAIAPLFGGSTLATEPALGADASAPHPHPRALS